MLFRSLQLKQGDVTEIGAELAISDVVVLDRVVCCYPDWKSLLEIASTHAHAVVAMSYPRMSWYTRAWVRIANAGMRMLRRTFRMYLHSPEAMQRLLHEQGFSTNVIGYRGPWELLIAAKG